MLSIRNKVMIGIGLLLVIVATLSGSGFLGVYAYRGLAKSMSGRANELPKAAELADEISDVRVLLGEIRGADGRPLTGAERAALATQFAQKLRQIRVKLVAYREQLLVNDLDDSSITDSNEEWQSVFEIEESLARINVAARDAGWVTEPARLAAVHIELERLDELAFVLPSFLHRRIIDFAGEVRVQYRALIIVTWITTVSATLLLGLFIRLFYTWVFRPLRVLIHGSRRVAGGEFGYRIALDTHDEMSELADAMNDMTARFESIRDDLDHQVQERTKQVVRSEQLASVGFLAAGVAHEINNPLASIALCAESLESRMQDLLITSSAAQEDRDLVANYLRMIQNEAFRCKGITERLLDFSRMGDVSRQNADLRELVQGVIDMVGHLGRYHDKHVEFAPGEPVIAPVNSQELKQVVLNLITNALDSLSPGGRLLIELVKTRGSAELVFQDNGCGMTDEVLKHLFEPFFTRRRNGQGTGLGLSITYRIVEDHGGHIDVHSEGPGKGSEFRVSLPLAEKHKESQHRYQAA